MHGDKIYLWHKRIKRILKDLPDIKFVYKRIKNLGEFTPYYRKACIIKISNNIEYTLFIYTILHELVHAFLWKKYAINPKAKLTNKILNSYGHTREFWRLYKYGKKKLKEKYVIN